MGLIFLVAFGCSDGKPVEKPADSPVTNPQSKHPETVKSSVITTYHGIKVAEDYQWLENWDNPKVQNWSNTQNKYARSVLDKLPNVDKIRARVKEIVNLMPVSYHGLTWRGGKLFAIKDQPPLNQPMLVVMPSPDMPKHERIILDPNKLDDKGSISIDWYVPSPDGKLVAVSLSKGGSEIGDLHIFETKSSRKIDEVIPRVNGGTAGGDLAWTPDGSGFYYTRYPRESERPKEDLDFYMQLWFHTINTPLKDDRYEIGKDFDRIAEIEVDMEPESGRVLATVQYGDSGRFAHYFRMTDGQWKQFTGYDEGVVEALFGPNGGLFVISRKDAPKGRVLHLNSLDLPLSQAKEIISESKDTIVSSFYGESSTLVTKRRLFLTYQLGGPSEIRVFDLKGNPKPGPTVLPVSSVGDYLTPLEDDDILFSNNSYIDPVAWYRFNAKDGTTHKTALRTEYPFDFKDTEVVREFVTSMDGTAVPLNIIRRKGIELNGQNPVVLSGYGGYGVSMAPRFRVTRRIWLDHGGVYAYANLRGGGEFGENWHKEGMLTKKQNVFDDFHACMQYLVDTKYTTPKKLAIEGGSNGGLLMAAMITQHPKAARTVISHVGIYDMLRVELSPNGKFNIPEYGTVEDVEQFKALYAYSPYHKVKDGVPYPAVLLLTGANDPRVDPMHSRKMTARLQKATSSKLPVLLRTSSTTGHGGGTPLNEQIEQHVDVLSFMFHHFDMPFQ
ncbi:MAG: S9 family peptidase [Proteobacteria bacterium]|nr:S9 family peptidase [Pseudomonadota bacterium]